MRKTNRNNADIKGDYMKSMINKIHRKDGSVLFTVLIVMTVVIILATASLTLTSVAYSTVVAEYRSQQAYYTAKSALDGVVDYLRAASITEPIVAEIEKMAVNGTSIKGDWSNDTDGGIGKFKVDLYSIEDNDELIKITSSSEYLGKTSSVTAIIRATEVYRRFDGVFTATGQNASTDSLSPPVIVGKSSFDIDEIILVSGVTLGGSVINTGDIKLLNGFKIDNSTADGKIDIVTAKDLHVSAPTSGGEIDGTIYVGRNMYVDNSGAKIGNVTDPVDVYVHGDLKTQFANYYGELYINGDLDVSGNANFYQPVYVNGNLHSAGGARFHAGVYVVGDVVNLSGNAVGGPYEVVYGGSITPDASSSYICTNSQVRKCDMNELYEELGSIVRGSVYTPWIFEEEKFEPAVYNIKLGTLYGDNEYKMNYTIDDSGVITNYETTNDGGKNLNFDTTRGDLHIKVVNPNADKSAHEFTFGGGINVNIIGDNEVYFLLDEGVSFKHMAYGGDKIGVGGTGNPQFYMISNSDDITIDFGNTDQIQNVFIYCPFANFKIAGSGGLTGAVVAGDINTSSTGNKFTYAPPSEELEIKLPPTTSVSNWRIQSYLRTSMLTNND